MMEAGQVPIRYCLYARKSSESDERQVMSLDAQLSEMLKIAEDEHLEIAEIKQESKSAKETGLRTEYNHLMTEINEGKFNGILTWAPDRLSRNAGDLGSLVDLMDKGKLLQIRTHGQTFANNPNEKFLLMILCSQAKLENDNRGKNVKRGLKFLCEKGKRPGMPPVGYKLYRDPNHLAMKSKIVIDPERAPFIKKMFEYVAINGFSGRQVNEYLYEEGLRTRKGKRLALSMMYRMFKDQFYYGEFEYPEGSGNWYKGDYESIITKELWQEANNRLKTYAKSKWGSKAFYYGKLFKCGSCGSGVCGEDRINRFGSKYVYYKCTKYGGKKRCNEKYIREEKLIESIAKMIEANKENDILISKKVLREVNKINQIQKATMGANAKEITNIDYIQYILNGGTNFERSQFLKCIDQQLYLKDGEVTLSITDDLEKSVIE
ncbi:MAG: resolvase protein [uncultured bacterium]|nr:MAG: resolvase protein [uncultured bacterium]